MAEDVARPPVVLVIGGTGVFGRLIVADLLTHTTLSVAVASRRGVAARGWLPGSEGRLASYRLDARNERAIRSVIERSRARVVVHAAGPYALIGDAPLRAALGAGTSYVDMCPRSDFFTSLHDRYDADARAMGITCIVGASTAGGLTGLLTKRAQQRMRRVDRVRSSLCVHNFQWGAGVAGDYLLSARRVLPHGRVGGSPERVDFPALGRRTVRLADTLDYVNPAPDAVRDSAYRIGLPNALPELGLRLALELSRLGVPLWRIARPLGVCAGLLGGSYTEGGLLHQAYGDGAEGRSVLETHVHRPFGNVRNPSLLCALAADRLIRGQIPATGVIHPASWLAPEELIQALIARAVTVRTRFLPEGSTPGTYKQVPWEDVL